MSKAVQSERKDRLESFKIGHVNLGLVAAGVVIAICLAFYLPLLRQPDIRQPVVAWFVRKLLPVALIHVSALLLISLILKVKARGAFLYWGLSLAVLLVAGDAEHAVAFFALAAFGLMLAATGSGLTRILLPGDWRSWPVSLGFGILAVSFAGACLSAVHLFKWWIVLLLVLMALFLALRDETFSPAAFHQRWRRLSSRWDLATALALEGAFLVFVFIYVAASRPETSSDAMRFYWPYVKLLKHNSGFFDIPFQWPYIIPQAGLTYAGALFLLAGPVAVRWSMTLAWVALVAIVARCRLEPDSDGSVPLAVVLVLASCPILLGVTSSLMHDTFVCLATVMLALVCLHAEDPGSGRFWGAVGGAAGLAMTSKYSTVVYAVPLGFWALIRSIRAHGWKKTIRGLAIAIATCVLAASPWLWHAYRGSGNPVFPFLLKIFPSQLWPRGLGKMNLDNFRLPPGPRGWFLWPIDLTYHTDRFAEGYAGSLGLVLPMLLLLGIPLLWKGTATERVLVLSAAIGTTILWFQTAYIRYWLPGLWLLTWAAAPAAARLARSSQARFWVCAAALGISLLQLPFHMMTSWLDPKGWPWDYYTGKVSDDDYLNRGYPGFRRFRNLEALNRGWPRVWMTAYEAAGHLSVQPMDALLWELEMHGAMDPRSKIKYLGSAGCTYWIVNRDSEDAKWLKVTGISPYYWDEKNLISSKGPAAVYRMKSAGEALEAFDSRARAGTDLLLDGGFEQGEAASFEYWNANGSARRISSALGARQGEAFAQAAPSQGLRQDVPLPPGLKSVELTCWVRGAHPDKAVSAGLEVNFSDAAGAFFAGQSETVPAREGWNQYRLTTAVPSQAVYAIVYLSSRGDGSAACFDDVHLYSQGSH